MKPELKDLLSGIGVVIDEKINEADDTSKSKVPTDPISNAIQWIEDKWNLPFCRLEQHLPDRMWPQLLKGASFIILDWKLWDAGAGDQVKKGYIKMHQKFLNKAKNYFVPVVIFTNESPEDVKDELSEIYQDEEDSNFVFIKEKTPVPELNFDDLEKWIEESASVYTLKSWEQSFYRAKVELFGSMYARSPNWPKVFWNEYKKDGVDPSSSLIDFLNQNLIGRMPAVILHKKIFEDKPMATEQKELRELIGETSLRSKNLDSNGIRCGDLFKLPKGKYLLNLRPDCDCIPKNDSENINDVELYCIEGKVISDNQILRKYNKGQLNETIAESIVFSVYEGKSLKFNFKKLRIEKYSLIKEQGEGRIGQLLHPYITRIQQRYALYLQRQGLPCIPKEAIRSL